MDVSVAGLVLAGGRGSRLGSSVPKPLVTLAARPLLAHVLDRIPPTVDPVLINAGDASAYAAFGLPVVADRIEGFQGPLAGLDAGCAWLRRERPEATHLLCLPGDTPFLPMDVGLRLLACARRLPRLATSQGRLHPTIGLWPLAVLDGLQRYLAEGASRSIAGFANTVGFETIAFDPSDMAPGGDPFFNVNTPADLAAAAAWFSG